MCYRGQAAFASLRAVDAVDYLAIISKRVASLFCDALLPLCAH